jgi:uncharacterized repeat protein (TIGR01451 family)
VKVEWRPLLFAVSGTLLVFALSWGAQVRAGEILFQTVPTPSPGIIPTPPAAPTPRPPEAEPSAEGALLVHLEASPQDVLPGEEIQFTIQLTNTSASAFTNVVVVDPLDPVLHLLEVRGTQGAVQFRGGSAIIYMGMIEAGRTELLTLRARVDASAQSGQVILNQLRVAFDGGEAISNVVAAGLPPAELPVTGQDRREP